MWTCFFARRVAAPVGGTGPSPVTETAEVASRTCAERVMAETQWLQVVVGLVMVEHRFPQPVSLDSTERMGDMLNVVGTEPRLVSGG